MIVSRSEFLDRLRSRISEEERGALQNDDGVLISRYNRATLLRMLNDDESKAGTVDTERADALEKALEAYLSRYMAENPEGHKWIILSCLYCSQVEGEPMHPREVAGWRREGSDYFCRAREDVPGSVCLWCVCQPDPL